MIRNELEYRQAQERFARVLQVLGVKEVSRYQDREGWQSVGWAFYSD